MTDAEASSKPGKTAAAKPKRPAQPRKKKAAAVLSPAAPPAPAKPAASRSAPASSGKAHSGQNSSGQTHSGQASFRKAGRPAGRSINRHAAGPGLGDWLSLGLIAVLVVAAAALYQWRGEANLGASQPAYSPPATSQPAAPPGTR